MSVTLICPGSDLALVVKWFTTDALYVLMLVLQSFTQKRFSPRCNIDFDLVLHFRAQPI